MDTYEEQVRLEKEMRDFSVERFHKAHEAAGDRNRFGETLIGRKILGKVVLAFTDALDEYCEHHNNKFVAAKMLRQFGDNRAVAYLFTKAVLNLIGLIGKQEINAKTYYGMKVGVFSATAGDMIHDEMALRHFNDNFPTHMRDIIKNCDVRRLTRHRRREAYKKEFRKRQMEWKQEGWSLDKKVQLSDTLMFLFIKTTGMIEKRLVWMAHNKSEYFYSATPEFSKVVDDMMKNNEAIHLLYNPMVHPPKPWEPDNLVSSPYLTENVRPYRVFKNTPVGYLRELELTDLSKPIRALNAVQSTPWRINTVILEALQVAYEDNYGVDSIPPSSDIELPPLPPELEKGSQEWKQNMADVALVHRLNRKSISNRINLLNALLVAKKFSKYEKIYFPHEFDSRGRMYPKPTYLNPQGPAHIRALLEFGEGKPIEDRFHVEYLAIAGANAFGHDKLSLQERIDWVWDNEEMFESIATNWREDRRWVHADSPFEFLRFCLEWKALGDHGPGFISHMPINFDATCSGLQHFSAMLKDEEGGKAVNLMALDERQDIYKAVALKAEASIKEDLKKPEKAGVANIALNAGITRALAKRPVMIVPYSGTFRACMRYTEAHYLEQFEKSSTDFGGFGEDYIIKTLTPYVAKHLWAAIGDTVIKAREAMDWITKVSRVITKGSKGDEPIFWVTPAGLKVRQYNVNQEVIKIWTYIDGKMCIKMRKDTDKINSRKTAQSISPNFIHSMDAAHLQLTVCAALDTGRDMSFSMIHDSFGVHAADMGVFVNDCIKPEFFKMYQGKNQLEDFLDQVRHMIDDEDQIPPMPEVGNLDLTEVLQSEFFFS